MSDDLEEVPQPEETPERETDQEIEDRHEKELAEERDRRAGFMGTPTEGEGGSEVVVEEEAGLPVEGEVAQDPPPEGTTADDT